MTHRDMQPQTTHLPTNYQIRVQGHLGSRWQAWFEGLTITEQPCGDTLLTGHMADQAALYGVLKKIRNLGLPLISVTPIAFKQT